ncbi:MAG: hypothetical protein AAGN66_22810 [Acidobacteriota bacterium]
MGLDDKALGSGSLPGGIAAAIAGDRLRARRLLWRAAVTEPHNELAWLWLAKVSENTAEYEHALARAVVANPQNRKARMSLEISQADWRDPARPWPNGRCPFCHVSFAEEPRECVRCGAILSLEDPEVFLEPLEVDRTWVRGFVDRATGEDGPSGPEHHRTLGLAYLNLGDLTEALAQLRCVADWMPEDLVVHRAVVTLATSLDRGSGASCFETDTIDRPSHEELGLA